MTRRPPRKDSRTSKYRSESRALFWQLAHDDPDRIERAVRFRNKRGSTLKRAATHCKISQKRFLFFVDQWRVCRNHPDGEEIFLRGSEKDIVALSATTSARAKSARWGQASYLEYATDRERRRQVLKTAQSPDATSLAEDTLAEDQFGILARSPTLTVGWSAERILDLLHEAAAAMTRLAERISSASEMRTPSESVWHEITSLRQLMLQNRAALQPAGLGIEIYDADCWVSVGER